MLLAAAGFCLWQLILAIQDHRDPLIIACAIGFAFSAFLLTGLFVVNPNEAKVLQLFGQYVGTAKTPGLRFANPLYRKRTISQRVRNFESGKLKVNDLDGNPIEIAAVVVGRSSTAEAVFEVDNYDNYVHVRASRRSGTWRRATVRRAR